MSNTTVKQFKFNTHIGHSVDTAASFRVRTMPAEILKNVNAENKERRRHLHQALRDSNYNLVMALLEHPDIDVTLRNDRGYNTKTYYKDYKGPHKELIKVIRS